MRGSRRKSKLVASWQAELRPTTYKLRPGYWASLQNGHLSVRAWSGLRQCQQKRGWGVSRALRRDWMSATFSVLPATADWARRTLARAAAGSRAASRRSEEHTSELQSLAYLVCR